MAMEIQKNGIGILGESCTFLLRFLRHPRSVGAIAPSSRFLARRIVRGLEFNGHTRVVEFGPGTGPITQELARVLPDRTRYVGIEREQVFVDVLQRRFPGFDFACDSVENLLEVAGQRGLLPLDHIVSGLPFASLPSEVTLPILDAAYDSLRPGGTFTTFQYVHAYKLPAARVFRSEMLLRFGPPSSCKVVLRNLPPAFVIKWQKNGISKT